MIADLGHQRRSDPRTDVGRGLHPIVQRSSPAVMPRSPNSTVPSRIIVAPSSTATG